jgi:hypothetical protein
VGNKWRIQTAFPNKNKCLFLKISAIQIKISRKNLLIISHLFADKASEA